MTQPDVTTLPRTRDHLFISYAGEDGALAEWLTLKLSSEGYRVWCDRFKLLGGESYPRDITVAIRERTFRFIPLLSHHSVAKENPVKERTLAQAVSRERKEEFILPVNVDGIKPHELDFQSTDLVFIPFHDSWARGLNQLLKKLKLVSAPKDTASGQQAVSRWLLNGRYVVDRGETVWSNLLPIQGIPATISRFEFEGQETFASLSDLWPFYRQNSRTAWSFFPPPEEGNLRGWEREKVDWTKGREGLPFKPVDAVSHLLRRSTLTYCRNRGMAIDPTWEEAYFPSGLFSDGWLNYRGYSGNQTRLKVVGERAFKVPNGVSQRSRYHLCASFDPFLGRFGTPVLSVSLGVIWTDLQGAPLPVASSQRRRKALCKTWWNHEWLSRLTALLAWLSEGKDEIVIAEADSGKLSLAARPLRGSTNVGIDEAKLVGLSRDDETSDLDDSENEREIEPESADEREV